MPASHHSLLLEQRYQANVAALWRRVAAAVRAHFLAVNRDDLAAGFRTFVPTAAELTAAAQTQAQVLAAGFLSAYVGSEVGAAAAWRPAALDPRVGGTTATGGSVADALAQSVGAVWMRLQQGKTIDQAMTYGAFLVAQVAGSAVADAAWREQANQYHRSGGLLGGWTWVTGGKGCPACLAQQNGHVRPAGEPLRRHAGCDCIQAPAVRGARDLVRRPTGEQLFQQLSPAEQVAMFKSAGEEKAALILAGKATLAEFTTLQETARGLVYTETGLKEEA